ncbi:MAG: xanthine dehydrogenase family protein subunit M [Syntrophobacteraceae bacterium]|nr:xanthine dehydrogenase family protein subunit M [Syntrophobacteraceae bacterium]
MMVLPDFQLVRPSSLSEALSALAENPGAMPVAGGTDLLVSMKHGLFSPTHLVDLKGAPELHHLGVGEEGATIGACVRLSRIKDHPLIRTRYRALSQAAEAVASPPLQNRGTLGGNVCLDTRCYYYNQSDFWRRSLGGCLKKDGPICRAAPAAKRCFANFSSDTVPALIALGARVRLVGGPNGVKSERTLPLEEFFVEDGIKRNVLLPGELVADLHLPPAENLLSGYRKYRQRASIDYPLVSVAVAFQVREGRIREARVAVGAMASSPVLALETMEVLEGALPAPELLASAAELVTKRTKPVGNQAGSPGHRRLMARVMCRRLLKELLEAGPL